MHQETYEGFYFLLPQTNCLIIGRVRTSDIFDWAEIKKDAYVRRFVEIKMLSFEDTRKYVKIFDNVEKKWLRAICSSTKRKENPCWYVWLFKGKLLY